jgi:hypothetical protein
MAEKKLQIEAGQTLVEFEALTDVGNQKVFTPSAAIMSGVVEPEVRVDGIVTGINLLSPGSSADTVAVGAFSANSQGTLYSVAAGTVDISTLRPATDVAKVISITMDSTGALAAVEGTDGTDATFSTTRGADGGPAYIPVGSVEIGQIHLTSSAAAVITTSEVKQSGDYTERSDFPVYDTNPIGVGIKADEAGKTNAYVEFNEALDTRHTGDVTKGVYCQYYTPSFADVTRVTDFTPAETSYSISSTATYDGAVGSESSSLGQASFSAIVKDGIQDLIVINADKNLTFKHYPNKNASAHTVTQGKVGISRSYPAEGNLSVSGTITASVATASFTA